MNNDRNEHCYIINLQGCQDCVHCILKVREVSFRFFLRQEINKCRCRVAEPAFLVGAEARISVR